MGNGEGRFSVSDLARMTGLSQASIRLYDDYLCPDRTGGGQRMYTVKDVDDVRTLQVLSEQYGSLPGANVILGLYERVQDLEDRIAELRGIA